MTETPRDPRGLRSEGRVETPKRPGATSQDDRGEDEQETGVPGPADDETTPGPLFGHVELKETS